MQRYVIKDDQHRILSVFHTNAIPPKNSIAIGEDLKIDSELYVGNEPRLKSEDNKTIVEIYPPSPGDDYDWNKHTKKWSKRPEPVDEIAEIKKRLDDLGKGRPQSG